MRVALRAPEKDWELSFTTELRNDRSSRKRFLRGLADVTVSLRTCQWPGLDPFLTVNASVSTPKSRLRPVEWRAGDGVEPFRMTRKRSKGARVDSVPALAGSPIAHAPEPAETTACGSGPKLPTRDPDEGRSTIAG